GVPLVRAIYQKIVRVQSFFFSSRRRHTRFDCDWSSDVCSSDLDSSSVFPFGIRRVNCVDKVLDNQPCQCQQHLPGWLIANSGQRSEERRVGKECRSRSATRQSKKSVGGAVE